MPIGASTRASAGSPWRGGTRQAGGRRRRAPVGDPAARCWPGCWRRGCRWRSGWTCRSACRAPMRRGGRRRISRPSCAGWRPRPDFFAVSAGLETVGPARPFYPARGVRGMTRAAHAAALGFAGPAGLSRWCDRATAERPAGAPLFWTLGANQSGKAAISAWRDWLVPALAAGAPIRLWPFEGGLHALLAPGRGGAGRGLSGRGAAALRAAAGRQQAGAGGAARRWPRRCWRRMAARRVVPDAGAGGGRGGRLRRRRGRRGPLRLASSACSG